MLHQDCVLESDLGCSTFKVGAQEGTCEEVASEPMEDKRSRPGENLGAEHTPRWDWPFLSPHLAFGGVKGEFLGAGPVRDPLSNLSGSAFSPGRCVLVTCLAVCCHLCLRVPNSGEITPPMMLLCPQGLLFGKHFQFLCLFFSVTPSPFSSPFPHAFQFSAGTAASRITLHLLSRTSAACVLSTLHCGALLSLLHIAPSHADSVPFRLTRCPV